MHLIVFLYVCSIEVDCSCSIISCSSDCSPSSTKSSTGGRSEISLSATDSKLEILSFLVALHREGESVLVKQEDLGQSVRGWSVESLLVDCCLGVERSVPVLSEGNISGRCQFEVC